MSDPPSLGPVLPEFDSAFRCASPLCFFHHTVDAEAASLHVQVIGPNLETTFTHDRAKQVETPGAMLQKLVRKTSGFLALVAPSGKRVVLAWAISGHGAGLNGDLMDASHGILENLLWTRRAIKMGRILGMGMGSPFDGVHRARNPQYIDGVTKASHVEIKLAVHAIHVLLKTFAIAPENPRRLSRQHLERLRLARWEDGSRPAFEIYFSRKYCTFCKGFITRLEETTGISLQLRWRHRLVRYKYINRVDRHPGLWAAARDADADADVLDVGEVPPDEDEVLSDEETVHGEIVELEMVDLTAEGSMARDNTVMEIPDDSPQPIDITTPSPRPSHQILDSYINGLAYCIGQIISSPSTARAAVVDLALKLRHQRNNPVVKPLPPTPETEPPSAPPEPQRRSPR